MNKINSFVQYNQLQKQKEVCACDAVDAAREYFCESKNGPLYKT